MLKTPKYLKYIADLRFLHILFFVLFILYLQRWLIRCILANHHMCWTNQTWLLGCQRNISVLSVNRTSEICVKLETPICIFLRLSVTLKTTRKKKQTLEHITQLCVPFVLPEDWQSVCSGHGTPLSDHIRHKQPEMKRYGDYQDKTPPSLSRDAERIVHPHVLNTNLSPSVTAPFITHKANPVSSTMRSICPSPLLSDSIEMNIRTPGYVVKWFVFPPPTEANFQRLINLGNISSQKRDVFSH